MVFQPDEDSEKADEFISADVTISQGSYDFESIQLLRGSYTRVHTGNFSNHNLNAYAYGGNYRVSGLDKYNGNKNVFGFGFDVGGSLNFKINKLKVGIGIMAGAGTEFGEYYNFRKNAGNEGFIQKNADLVTLNLSFFPVIAYEFSESTVLSGQINLGLPGFISPGLLLNSEGFVYWLGWSPDYDNRNNTLGRRVVFGFMMDINKLNFSP